MLIRQFLAHELAYIYDRERRHVTFNDSVEVTVRALNGERFAACVGVLAIEREADSADAAVEELAKWIGTEAARLISTPSTRLERGDVEIKGRILSVVDALNSNIGLLHPRRRWFLGVIDGNAFKPIRTDTPDVEIPPDMMPEATSGFHFALVPIHRDGTPSGPVEEIEPMGGDH